MERRFLDKVEDNAAVRIWSETTQQEKGDNFTRISITQNDLQELKGIWDHWDEEARQLFYSHYGDLPYLLDMKVDKHLFRALAQFWNPAYSCFSFGKVDLVPTIEEYMALLRCSKSQVDRIYSRAANVPFLRRLMNITGMSEQWVTARIKQKGDNKCISWRSLKDVALVHPDIKKRVDIFALSIYGLVIFPRALGHIDEAVTDLFDRLDKGVTPVPAILAETFRSLSTCRRAGEGRFIGCAQLLLAWFHSHFWKVDKVSYRVFSENYSPLKETIATPRRDDISMEKWMAILQNLHEEDIEWRAPWLLPDEILYRCGSFDWVPLLGIWGAIGYAPLLVLRQYRSRQFIPATQGLAECEFSYGGDGYKKRIREISNAWNQTRQMKRLAVGPMTTPEYEEWRVRRINDNVPKSSPEGSHSIEEHLRVIPSELEILKQDFERRNAELEKQIEQMEEEKTNLRLDVDVQKLEMERLRKGKARAEEDLDSLKTDYKKLRSSMRTAGLGKTSEQWRKEVQEEKNKADRWETRFQEVQTQNETLKKSLSENQKEKGELENRVSELEESLHRHRNRNSVMELKVSLSRIEEMKRRIEELEAALRSCEMRIEHMRSNEDRQTEQLHYFQNQVRDRDQIMGEAVLQIREVADHLQTLAVQADVLSVKYELESSRGQELASLLRRIRILSFRAKSYM
ncbi:hypothetical protein V6Z11_D11G089500 [Gossypium hirsutum]